MSDLSEGLIVDSDHYLVVAKVRERLAVSKRMVKKMDIERFNLYKLNGRRLKNTITLQSKTGLQLWKTEDDNGGQGKYRSLSIEVS
jgi:hypothetical protein